MITQDKINSNYLKFIQCLEKYGCYSEEMITEMGEKIKYAPYSLQKQFGGAEPGGLINVTLNHLCKMAININNKVFGVDDKGNIMNQYLYVNPNMIMRVLLLMNIAKAEVLVENPSKWHRDNLGKMYEYKNMKTKMDFAQRALYLCQKYNIKLEEEEYEAFHVLSMDEDNRDVFQSPLFVLIKSVIMLTNVTLRQEELAKLTESEETIEK
jgi:hypothetical protein